MKKIEEEKQYLEYSLDCINTEIEKSTSEIKKLRQEGNSLSFEDTKRGEHLNISAKIGFYENKIRLLKNAIPSPYFGRFDFLPEGKNAPLKIYIGKTGIDKDGNFIITDWRAPICNLYYDSNIGDVEYEAPNGIQKGNLQLKRQINIQDSKLIDIVDSNLVTNDELLKPYLSEKTDNKMKTIIETIQKEQNQIIRKPITDNIIIQGVAGSGKTSVALHRIAYLIYSLGSKINSNQFLVLGPNEYFLNYVSSILPELETEPVDQKTFLKLANECLNENLTYDFSVEQKLKKSEQESFQNIQAYKSSLDFKNALDEFLNNYLENDIVLNGFELDGEVIYTPEEIKKILFFKYDKYPDFDGASNYFVSRFKDNMDSIWSKLNKKYRQIYINLPKDDPRRKEAVEKSVALSKLIKEKGVKLLKDYFKKLKTNPINLYKVFIASLVNYNTTLLEQDLLMLQKNTLSSLRKKKVTFEDLPSLMHINYILNGKKIKYKNIVIDEAQDYGLFHFDVIKEITQENTNFSIYGDLAQSIYSYRSIDSWDSVNDKVFDNNFSLLNLSKSYRTTIEITNNANNILEQLNLNLANPVIRHGEDVEFLDECNNPNYKYEKIENWINKGYRTIAVICKTEKEAQNTYKDLINQGIDAKYISATDDKYDGGVFVLTSASAKGLEFDVVIVNDASDNIYSSDSKTDMHLLYVACTRALHEQLILYNKQLTKVFNFNFDKKQEKIKKLTK